MVRMVSMVRIFTTPIPVFTYFLFTTFCILIHHFFCILARDGCNMLTMLTILTIVPRWR
jgi:hypothetical protein